MTITSTLKPVLDRKQWEMCSQAPTASVAGSLIMSSTLFDQLQLFIASATLHYLYDPIADSWINIPSGALSAFAGGSCGVYHPNGPTGTGTAGAASTITTALTIPGSLAGYKIRITGGTGAGQERTIASNTYGATSIITTTATWTTNPDATSVFLIQSGRFWVFSGTATNGLKYYDVATNTWSAALSVTGVTAAFATDAKLRSTPGGSTQFASGTSTGTNSTTTLNNTGKAWTTNQWTNYQIRLTGGVGAGQVRTVASNTGTAITVSAAWSTTPDATSTYVIEGNDDFLYLIGNSAVTMFRYSISGNTWSTLSPGVARGAAPTQGSSLQWVRSVNDSLWTAENAILNGRRLYSFRGGGVGTLDYYDIPGNTWVNAVTYNRASETFTTGTDWDNGANGNLYCQKDATSRFFRYSALNQQLDAFSLLNYPQNTALVGDRAFTVDVTDGATTLTWLYHMKNTGTELFRILIF
jgi:hypothetical protein